MLCVGACVGGVWESVEMEGCGDVCKAGGWERELYLNRVLIVGSNCH